MLGETSSSAIVAVSDIGRARRFYSETLGLAVVEEEMGDVLVFRTGATHLVVYRSDEAGTNRANAVVFDAAGALREMVAALRGKGVAFERYDFEGVRYEGGIHEGGGMRMSWFKDPDGNILHLNETIAPR